MTFRVSLFAAIRDAAGQSEIELPFAPDQTVSADDVLRAVAKRFPDVTELVQHSRLAVNDAYVGNTQTIRPDDRLAIIPPVSGG